MEVQSKTISFNFKSFLNLKKEAKVLGTHSKGNKKTKTPVLDNFGKDLTLNTIKVILLFYDYLKHVYTFFDMYRFRQ